MSLMRPISAAHAVTQGFLGTHPLEPRGWVKLVKGIWRGWRTPKLTGYRRHVHLAVDIGCAVGTPVFAVHDGRVVSQFIDTDGAVVIYQRIRQTRLFTYAFVYWHLKKGSFRQPQGTFVKRGKVIALSGATGNVDGAHFHGELWKVPRGTPKRLWYRLAQRIDPLPFFDPNGKNLTAV